MIITKKQSKNLRYFARANYKSDCKGVETENGKVKHREFPCFELAYDEAKATAGNVELTHVTIGGTPFEGDYDALMTRLRKLLDNPDEVCSEELEQDKTLMEQAVNADNEKSDTVVISDKPGETLKDVLKDVFPEGSEISVDIKPEDRKIDVNVAVSNKIDHIDVQIEAVPDDPLDNLAETTVDDILASMNPCEEHTEEPAVSSVWLDTKEPDFSVEVAPPVDEPVEVTPQVATSEPAKDMSVEAELVGEPRNYIPKDATLQDAEVVEAPKKELTQPELYALRTELAIRKLARSYGESDEATLQDIVLKHPDAMDRLNGIFSADGITPYTMTEESIRGAYEV